MDELLALLGQVVDVPEELKEHLMKIMIPLDFKYKSFLSKPGRVNDKAFYIIKGLVRCYTIHKGQDYLKEYELNKWFKFDGDLITSSESFERQIPSTEYFQALKPTAVLMTTFEELAKIYKKWPVFYQVGHYLASQHAQFEDHVSDMLRLPSQKERYEYLLTNLPYLNERVPQKYLATFMGMEPTTLSKIKAARPSQ